MGGRVVRRIQIGKVKSGGGRWGNQYTTPLAIRSQAEVGRILGICRQQVDRDEKSALAKLRVFFSKGQS